MATVLIKELSDPNEINFGLEKEGRTKLPGCGDYVQPAQRNGKWLTGLDEAAPEVIAKGIAEVERVRAEREELERLTGKDLSPTNDNYWENVLIPINRNIAFDDTNPEHRIQLAALRARKNVAPNPDVSKGEYPGVKYYLTRPEEESGYRLKPKKEKAEALARLVDLMKDTNKARILARTLGFSVGSETSPETMYEMFYNYIDRFPKENTIKLFNEQMDRPIVELQVELSFDEAYNKGLIINDKGTFRRGNLALGRTKKEAVNKLLTVEFSGELEMLLAELNER